PVASWILPKALRYPVAVIYTFARTADDIADEGDDPTATRLEKLAQLEQQLLAVNRGQNPSTPLMQALSNILRTYPLLSLDLFLNLLVAFRQDVLKTRYANLQEVLNYCVYSANPIGRLLLQLVGVESVDALKASDNVCTSLQLINFCQD